MSSFPEESPQPPGPVLEQGHTRSLQKEEGQLMCVGDRPEPTVPLDKPFWTLLWGEVGKLTRRYICALGTLVYPGGGMPMLPANTSNSGNSGTLMPQPVCAARMGDSL